MKVLLTHGWTIAGDPREQEIMRPFPPLGLQYLAAFVGRHDVQVWDPTFGSLDEWPGVLDRERPDVVGIYGHTVTRPALKAMIREAKGRGLRVVAGGPDPVQYLEEYLAMEFAKLGCTVERDQFRLMTWEGDITKCSVSVTEDGGAKRRAAAPRFAKTHSMRLPVIVANDQAA